MQMTITHHTFTSFRKYYKYVFCDFYALIAAIITICIHNIILF